MNVYYSDVDDTIASNSKISNKLSNYIKEIDDLFIPCSGRPLISMKKMFKKLNVKYLIGFNGAQIYDLVNEELIFNKVISLSEVKELALTLKKLDVDFLIYGQDDVFSTNIKNEYSKVEAEICDIKIKKIDNLIETPKILGLCDPKKIDEVIIKLQSKFLNLEICKSKPFFIEITPKAVNKGNAILWLNDLLKIDKKNVFCFGDSDNDISMFDLNINKVAVKNANESIKKRANFICDSCEKDGVYKFLKGRENE